MGVPRVASLGLRVAGTVAVVHPKLGLGEAVEHNFNGLIYIFKESCPKKTGMLF